ncbi:hypothetical protein BGZ94_007589 [Podila epigama]|nr:hypothetical protein BGZ94_007589 [Podila epigama]
MDQQHYNFIEMASRVSGKSLEKIERSYLKRLDSDYSRRMRELGMAKWRRQQQEQLGCPLDDRDGVQEVDIPVTRKSQRILQRTNNMKATRERLSIDYDENDPGVEGDDKRENDDYYNETYSDETEDSDSNSGNHEHEVSRQILKYSRTDHSSGHRSQDSLGTSGSNDVPSRMRHSQQNILKLSTQKPSKCLGINRCTIESTQVPKTTPAIFYVPHQDDDALAMALGIREHIEAGRQVIVHLYSDGVNSLLRDIVAGSVSPCPLHPSPHLFNLTLQDVVTGRTHEFRQSLRQLGVLDENIFEAGWSDIEPLKDYPGFKKKLKDLIVGYEDKYPGASHKCISGEYDRDGLGRNPTHRACWDVARELIEEYTNGYPISKQPWDFPEYREAQFILALPQFLKYKQRALEQYKNWRPKRGELAWGYHSVKALIDASYDDPYVYLDMLDNDPTNPESPQYVASLSQVLLQSPEDKTRLLEQLPPKDVEAIRAEEESENEQAEQILRRFEQAMRGPEGRGYVLP